MASSRPLSMLASRTSLPPQRHLALSCVCCKKGSYPYGVLQNCKSAKKKFAHRRHAQWPPDSLAGALHAVHYNIHDAGRSRSPSCTSTPAKDFKKKFDDNARSIFQYGFNWIRDLFESFKSSNKSSAGILVWPFFDIIEFNWLYYFFLWRMYHLQDSWANSCFNKWFELVKRHDRDTVKLTIQKHLESSRLARLTANELTTCKLSIRWKIKIDKDVWPL